MAGNRSRWDERRKSYSLRSAIGHKPYAICSSLSGRGGRLAGLRVPKKTPDPLVLIEVLCETGASQQNWTVNFNCHSLESLRNTSGYFVRLGERNRGKLTSRRAECQRMDSCNGCISGGRGGWLGGAGLRG